MALDVIISSAGRSTILGQRSTTHPLIFTQDQGINGPESHSSALATGCRVALRVAIMWLTLPAVSRYCNEYCNGGARRLTFTLVQH